MAVNVANHGPCRTRRSAGPAGDPILTSKITVPEVPEWAVLRPRITGLIAEGTRWCPLTVVTGPPGAGKTMAVALWAAAQTGPVAWVGLDDFDNRPGMFWSYVVAALRRSGVAVPRAMQLARQPRAVGGWRPPPWTCSPRPRRPGRDVKTPAGGRTRHGP